VPETDDVGELMLHFRNLARTSLPRAPLNAALASGIAERPDLARLLLEAPPEQRQPVLLLAALHDLVLREPRHRLAEWYGSVVPAPRPADDPRLMPTVGEFISTRTLELTTLLRTRRTQTNEVGRCALYLLGMSGLDDDAGDLAWLDIGSSGGLALQMDRYHYRFDPGGVVGPASPVVLTTGLRGDAPVPTRLPRIAARCGVDVAPLDVNDPDAARWLEACCWPDQADRFARLHAAIGIARESPPELLAGDAVASLAPAVDRMAPRGHPVVTNSWVLNYLPPSRQTDYVRELDLAGGRHDLTWIFVESPRQTPGLPWPPRLPRPDETHLMRATWRSGERRLEHLARVHPHGYWAHWEN
jgi:hypothetical protein